MDCISQLITCTGFRSFCSRIVFTEGKSMRNVYLNNSEYMFMVLGPRNIKDKLKEREDQTGKRDKNVKKNEFNDLLTAQINSLTH